MRWFDGSDGADRRLYRSTTIHGTKADAQRCLNGVLRNRDLGTFAAPSKITLNAFLDRWEAQAKVTAATLARCQALHRRHVRPELGQRRLDSLSLLDMQELVECLAARERCQPQGTHQPRAAAAPVSEPAKLLSPRTVRIVHAVMSLARPSAAGSRLLRGEPRRIGGPASIRRSTASARSVAAPSWSRSAWAGSTEKSQQAAWCESLQEPTRGWPVSVMAMATLHVDKEADVAASKNPLRGAAATT